jgi:uncharacterized protein (TIGR02996 family)
VARFERGSEVFEITSEDAEYLTQQRDRLRAGWARVRDPRCEVSVGGEPCDPVLEQALHADPCDLGAALVYADWLQHRGHPRGALIAVQHAMVHRPDDAGLRAEEARLIIEAGDALLSAPLVTRMGVRSAHPSHEPLELSPRNLPSGGALTWDHGFLRQAFVLLRPHAADEDLFWEVLRHPSARFLAELHVHANAGHGVGLVVALLLAARPPLRKLHLRVDSQPRQGSRAAQGPLQLAGLSAAMPALEDLELEANHVTLTELELPRLRRFVVQARAHDLAQVLRSTSWPALEELAIARPDPRALAAAFEAPRWPMLRVLRLTFAARGIELARLVVRSPQAGQLELLDLTGTDLEPEAISLLVEHQPRFARLAKLRVTQPPENGIERLQGAGFAVELDR